MTENPTTTRAIGVIGMLAILLGGLVALGTGGASGDAPEKVTICHVAGRADNPANHVTLTLAYPAVYGPAGHFNENGTTQAGHENDYLGPCDPPVTVATTEPEPTTTVQEPTTTGLPTTTAPPETTVPESTVVVVSVPTSGPDETTTTTTAAPTTTTPPDQTTTTTDPPVVTTLPPKPTVPTTQPPPPVTLPHTR